MEKLTSNPTETDSNGDPSYYVCLDPDEPASGRGTDGQKTRHDSREYCESMHFNIYNNIITTNYMYM